MTSLKQILHQCSIEVLTPVLTDLGFRYVSRPPSWTRGDSQIRLKQDSKSTDPYSGGAFTLEFELSPDRDFGKKLAGRVGVEQLLDSEQRAAALRRRNSLAARLKPPSEVIDQMPENLREHYVKWFEPAEDLEPRFGIRFRTIEECREWMELLAEMMPALVERALKISPRKVYAMREPVV